MIDVGGALLMLIAVAKAPVSGRGWGGWGGWRPCRDGAKKSSAEKGVNRISASLRLFQNSCAIAGAMTGWNPDDAEKPLVVSTSSGLRSEVFRF